MARDFLFIFSQNLRIPSGLKSARQKDIGPSAKCRFIQPSQACRKGSVTKNNGSVKTRNAQNNHKQTNKQTSKQAKQASKAKQSKANRNKTHKSRQNNPNQAKPQTNNKLPNISPWSCRFWTAFLGFLPPVHAADPQLGGGAVEGPDDQKAGGAEEAQSHAGGAQPPERGLACRLEINWLLSPMCTENGLPW